MLFVSCHKEGDLLNRCRINEIYSEREVYCDGNLLYTLPNNLVERWFWDGNELYRIDYYEDEDTYSENFFYNNRHQIVSTTVPAYDMYSEIAYDGKKLDHIDIYIGNRLCSNLSFSHNKGHISHAVVNTYGDTKSPQLVRSVCHLSSLILNPDVAQLLASRLSQPSKGSVELDFVWDKDNLVSMRDASGSGITYAYDPEGRNPFFNLLSLYELDNNVMEMEFRLLSRNLISRRTLFEGHDSTVTTWSYQYNNSNYPQVSFSECSVPGVNYDTWDVAVYTTKDRRTYYYVGDNLPE